MRLFPILLLIISVFGCATAQGGKTEKTNAGMYTEIRPDGTVIQENNRQGNTTEQGSGTGIFATPIIGSAKEGELGTISFAGMKAGMGNVVLGVLMIGLAFVFWKFLASPMLAVVCLAVGILSFLFPVWLGILALGVLACLCVYQLRGVITELVRGNAEALAVVPTEVAERIKDKLKGPQGPTTQAVVREVKGKP